MASQYMMNDQNMNNINNNINNMNNMNSNQDLYDPPRNDQMGSTMQTDLRRRYPKDNVGVKNEWAALIKHQHEMYENILRSQRELKALQSKQLGNDYDKNIAEKISEKQKEILMKQQEADLMDKKLQEFQRAEFKVRQDRAFLQNYMAQVYENSMEQKHKASLDQKMSQLEEEKKIIEENNRKLEEENRRRFEKVQAYHSFVQKEQDDVKIKKQLEREIQMKDKDDYKNLLKTNEEKYKVKEANYRNFYMMAAENQKQLEDMHIKSVLSPELEKKHKLDNIIQKGVEENEKKTWERELQKQQLRQQLLNDMGEALKTQLTYKEYQNEMEKLQRIYGKEEVAKQMLDYQSFLKYSKDKKYQQQAMYRDILDKQKREAEELQRLNRMTKHEKKINFEDLQAFKTNDPTLHTLIPGFQHTKSPEMRTLYKSYDGTRQQQPNGASNDVNNMDGFSSPDHSPNQIYNNNNDQVGQLRYSNSQNDLHSNQYQGYPSQNGYRNSQTNLGGLGGIQNKPNDPYFDPANPNILNRDFSGKNIAYKSQPNTQNIFQSPDNIFAMNFQPNKHNPVTNPLPFNTQNPYIIKEMSKLASEKGLSMKDMAQMNNNNNNNKPLGMDKPTGRDNYLEENFSKLQKFRSKDYHFSSIPPKLFYFIEGKKFYNLLDSLITYCEDLIIIENKQAALEKEAKDRGLQPPRLLMSDIQRLANKGKDVAFKYSLILMEEMNQRLKGQMGSTTEKEERDFYEAIIALINLIMKDYFPKEDHNKIEEEISRLFRTNAFNQAKRKHFLEEKYQKYPVLKDSHGKESVENIVNKLLKRSTLPRENWDFQYYNEKSDIKPGFLKLKPFEALKSRSPLLSILAPPIKLRVVEFDKSRKYRCQGYISKPLDTTVHSHMIPTLVEKEMNKRNMNSSADMSLKKVYQSLNKSFY